MIITSHMHTIIQIYPCLLKLSGKQESVTADSGYFYIPHRYRGEINIYIIKYGGSRDRIVVRFMTTYAISDNYH